MSTAAEQIKIGSVARSERLAKYNRLLRIAEGPYASTVPPFSYPNSFTCQTSWTSWQGSPCSDVDPRLR